MKRVFIIFPLAFMLANCSTSRNATSTTGTNSTTGATDATATATTGAATSGSMATSGTTPATGTLGNSSSNMNSSTTMSADVYDPKNFMQNPEKYKTPAQLGAAGGWTYNTDWRRNINFPSEAVGQWQLSLTPEVMANWMADTSRPETYASYWTPEATMRRFMMAAAKYSADTAAAALQAAAGMQAAGMQTAGMDSAATTTTTAATTATPTVSAEAGATSMAATATGTGSTGTVGNGGTGMTIPDSSGIGESAERSILTAVNGNNFMMPRLNLYLGNGSITGYTGSNNILGNVTINGNSLRFENLMPASNIPRIGGGFDQAAFIDRLSRVESYEFTNNEIRLKQGDQVLMVLTRPTQQ